jgi:hypothetical protein
VEKYLVTWVTTLLELNQRKINDDHRDGRYLSKVSRPTTASKTAESTNSGA